jgi:hypothetical protein
MDASYAEFELSSNRPSFHAYFNTDSNGSLSMRSRHTLSMLGRKASALAFTRNPFEPENQNNWSAVSQSWKKSLALDTSSIEPSAVSDAESLYTPDTSSMAQTKEVAIKKGTQAPRTSPSLSTLSSSDGIDMVRASPSTANSSDGRYSRESSPATSTSVSHPEDESAQVTVIDRHLTPAQRPNPKALALPPLQIPTGSGGSQNPDSWQKELLLNTDGQVMGGTLRGLVGRMTSHDTPVEATFFHSFFMTFRLFTTSVEFSNALIARFSLTFELNTPVTSTDPSNNISRVTPIRLRVYNVMKSWLELHWRMETDEIVLPVIMRWAESQLSTALPVPAERLIDLVQKRMKESQLGIQPVGPQARTKAKQVLGAAKEENYGKLACPSPIISKTVMAQLRASSFNFSALQLSDFDPIELARQITLMESKLYLAIQPEEVIGQLFNKKSGAAVNVRAMSALSTKMTGWFTETILNEDDLRKRTQILKFLIKLGSVSDLFISFSPKEFTSRTKD